MFYEERQTKRFCGFQAENPWFLSCATIKTLSSREEGPKGGCLREDFGFCLRKREARGSLSRESFDDLFAQKRKSEKGLRFGRQPRPTTPQKREIFIFFASKLMEITEKKRERKEKQEGRKGGDFPILMTQRPEKG